MPVSADIYNTKNTVKIHIQGGIVAARAMTSIFMVHSVLAVSETGRVTRELGKEEKNFAKKGKAEHSASFSEILQQEVEEWRTDSINCRTTTYGMDRRLHHFEYRAREYHY